MTSASAVRDVPDFATHPVPLLPSDFIWPFLAPSMGVIPNPKMAFIFPISYILVLIFPISMIYFPECEGKGSFPKSQIKSLPPLPRHETTIPMLMIFHDDLTKLSGYIYMTAFTGIKSVEITCTYRPLINLRMRTKELIFLFLNQNICCGCSKEPSQ